MKRGIMVLAFLLLVTFTLVTFSSAFAELTIPKDAKFAAVKADKTKMYHDLSKGDCAKKLKTMKAEELTFFKSKEEAEKAGYKACKTCCVVSLQIPKDAKLAAVKSDKTKMYHDLSSGECAKKLKTMKAEELTFFKSKEEAEKAGYKSCKACIK